ncbi:uncharacterized protein LOC130949906 [Arachis stenosperma]|uniref:uncharacterized protein LOC130949906 n=1 Tax=Arachis stenosperma TaxID=217475 RepID=UPI0025AC7C69|nr:uncharacterized protein LOC130949906 [Arachis stenosperma]
MSEKLAPTVGPKTKFFVFFHRPQYFNVRPWLIYLHQHLPNFFGWSLKLQQANQRMAEKNQRMTNQIAELTNARIENNNDRNEQTEEAEHESDPTHVSETAWNEKDQLPGTNKLARLENEETRPDNSVGPFTVDILNFQIPRRFTLPTTIMMRSIQMDLTEFCSRKGRNMGIEEERGSNTASSTLNLGISKFSVESTYKGEIDHFAAFAIYLHDSDYLNTIKQGQNESLKDYITRFIKVAMSIPDLHPEVHLHAIKGGLRPGKFQEAIAVSKPKTLAEFRKKAKGLMDIEELRQARKAEKP